MGVCVVGQFARFSGVRARLKVWMFQGVDGCQAGAPVELETVLEEGQGGVREVFELLADIAFAVFEGLDTVAAGQVGPAWHVGVGGGADELEDEQGLVDVGFT